ncbi:MAG: HD domain-containing protein, partial [Candidatus Latescibacteria bacterium]|nr:HD domain-containing protein [Candidatus Latescibacterota bacterium]
LVCGNDVRIGPNDANAFCRKPRLLVDVYAVAGARGLPLSCYTASRIEHALESCPDDLPEREEVRAAFHDLLTMGAGVSRSLRLMHETGALVKLIPEFGEISWHYQYDFYHTYTTDEHSIRVVENLEFMATSSDAAVSDLREIMRDVTAKNALYLAGLLHDIGKLGGRGHAHRGEIMAGRALVRLGFDNRTVELVRFLIREHLLMSHISQRRDIDDKETIGDFVERVGSTNRLRMLTLLTFADLMALSEGALTEWKKTLLRDLYRRALMLIEKGYEQHAASRGQDIGAIAESLAGDFPPGMVREHLRLLPGQYIRVTSRSAIRRHIRGIGIMKQRGVWASFRRTGDVTLLTVVADDYPRALSDICGTITASGINITGARIFTRNDGVIIDAFLVTDVDGNAVIPNEIQRSFKRNIADIVGGATDAARLIAAYLRRWRRKKRNVVFAPPRVRIHNDVSSRYTVIDVFTIDYTGLLYDITSVLASFKIDIHTARVGTDEDQVADAFYVRTGAGEKIVDDKAKLNIERALVERLNEAFE